MWVLSFIFLSKQFKTKISGDITVHIYTYFQNKTSKDPTKIFTKILFHSRVVVSFFLAMLILLCKNNLSY